MNHIKIHNKLQSTTGFEYKELFLYYNGSSFYNNINAIQYAPNTQIFYKIDLSQLDISDVIISHRIRIPISRTQLAGNKIYTTYIFKLFEAKKFESQVMIEDANNPQKTDLIKNAMNYDISNNIEIIDTKYSTRNDVTPPKEFVEFDIKNLVSNALLMGKKSITLRIEMDIQTNYDGNGYLILYGPLHIPEPTVSIELITKEQKNYTVAQDSIHFNDGTNASVNLQTGEFSFDLPSFSTSSNFTPFTFGGKLGVSSNGLLGIKFKTNFEYDFIKDPEKDRVIMKNYLGNELIFRCSEIGENQYEFVTYVENQKLILVEQSNGYELYQGTNKINISKHYDYWVIKRSEVHNQIHRLIYNWDSSGQYNIYTPESDMVEVLEENQKIKSLYLKTEKIYIENLYSSNYLTQYKVYLWDKDNPSLDEKIAIYHLEFIYDLSSSNKRLTEIKNHLTFEQLKVYYQNPHTLIISKLEQIGAFTNTRDYSFDFTKRKFAIKDQFNHQTTGYLDTNGSIKRIANGKHFNIYKDESLDSEYHQTSKYNFIKNSEFKLYNSNKIPDYWQNNNLQGDNVLDSLTINGVEDQLAFAFTPSSGLEKSISQIVSIGNGKKEDQFLVSMWANFNTGNKLDIRLVFKDSNTVKATFTKEVVAYDIGWQYYTFAFTADSSFSEIELKIVYQNQNNQIMINDVSLYKVNKEIEALLTESAAPTIEFNEDGSIKKVLFDSGDYIQYTYHLDGQPLSTEYQVNGTNRRNEYDTFGNVILETYTDAKGRIQTKTNEYTLETNLLSVSSNELGEKTQYTYDKYNRLINVVTPNGLVYQNKYDDIGRLSLVTNTINDLKEETNLIYTTRNLIRSLSSNYKPVIEYSYTQHDLVKEIKINNHFLERYQYDILLNNQKTDLLSQISFGGVGSNNKYNFSYDKKGRLIELLYNNNLDTSYTYDSNDFIKDVTYDGGNTHKTLDYDYNGNLALIEITKTGLLESRINYEYNDLSLLVNKTYTINDNQIEYKYLQNKNINSLGHKEQKVQYKYMGSENHYYSKIFDDVGRLIKKVYNNQEQIYQYYEENNILNTKPSVETLMDGTQFIYTYDEMGYLIHRVHSSAENKILEMKAYVYDGLNRLTKESIYNDENSYLESCTYVYDIDGNIIEKTIEDYTGHIIRYVYTYAIDVKNRLEQIVKHETGAFDEIETFSYPSNNQFYPSSIGGKTMTYKGRQIIGYGNQVYTYNDQGIRTKKVEGQKETSYILEGINVIESKYHNTLTLETVIINYHYDDVGNLFGLRYNDIEYIYERDIIGNILSIVDNMGKVYVSYTYSGYGVPSIKVNTVGMTMSELEIAHKLKDYNIYLYKGYIYDSETQMYYLNSRYYNPKIGRFITPDDPSYLSIEHINGLNLYAYCGNNPVMYIKGNINSDVNGIKTVDFLNTTQGRLNTVKKSINKPNKKGYSNNLLNTITTSGMPNVVSMTHVSTQLIENVLIGKLIGNVSYKITTQLNDSNLLYAYTNIGNGEVEYGIGLNVGNFYGLSAYTSSNLGIGISSQLAPWFTYGSEVSLINGVTFSFGTISGNITSEVSVNVGWGTIAGAYATAAGLAALPIPGARLVAGLAVLVILIIDINN